MANIVLTNKCNLNCQYCFAKDYIQNKDSNFSVENFQKAVNFIKTGKDEKIGLVGGEPFLHPEISEILRILEIDNDINSVAIYTNGTRIKQHINSLKNKKFHLLINCNSPENIGNQYNILKENIILLEKENIKRFVLGINLFPDLSNYLYIFELLKHIDSHILRFSISFSKEQKKSNSDILNYFKKFKPIWINFIKECEKRGIFLIDDCNPMPSCLINKDEKNIIQRTFLPLNKKKCSNMDTAPCIPLIDIFPDLTAVRSFCYSLENKVAIAQFKDIDTLRGYFYNEIDKLNNIIFINKKCKTCMKRLKEECKLCPILKRKIIK